MAINDNTKGMIDALAKGDIPKAKAYAQCILANDKAEKNKYWRESRSAMLTSGQENVRLELPAALLTICELYEPDKLCLEAENVTEDNWKEFVSEEQMMAAYKVADLYTGPVEEEESYE